MVSNNPPLDQMTVEDQERFNRLTSEVEEDAAAVENTNGRVASSDADLMPSIAVRFREEPIIGLEKPVRFRSLTAAQFLSVSEQADQNILLYSVCDERGDLFLTEHGLERMKGNESDARTYMHLIQVANDHCLAGGTLEGLTEAAAGNSPADDSPSTG